MNEVKVITTYSQGLYFAVVWRNTLEIPCGAIFDGFGNEVSRWMGDLESTKNWCQYQLAIYNEPNEP